MNRRDFLERMGMAGLVAVPFVRRIFPVVGVPWQSSGAEVLMVAPDGHFREVREKYRHIRETYIRLSDDHAWERVVERQDGGDGVWTLTESSIVPFAPYANFDIGNPNPRVIRETRRLL